MPVSFDVLKEGKDQWGIQLFYLELGRCDTQPPGSKAHQKLEGVGVSFDGVHAQAPIAWQVLAQEGLQIRSECVHERPPVCKASPAWAICRMSAGVACRYQYVS